MKLTFCLILVFVFAPHMNDAASDKRLVLEMDIQQEIINLKQAMTNKDAEISDLRELVTKLQKLVTQLQQQIGSTYTRWGRTTCPGNGTSLVYSGYMAGTYLATVQGNDQTDGAGANYLCLSGQPTWDHFSETVNNHVRITGVEYEFSQHSVQAHDLQAFFGSDIYNSEAPCSVCRCERSTTIMIPGRKDCYPGWTKEYSGYLVGGYPEYDDATEYICLDRRPETVVRSGTDDNDNLLYFVEATCGKSLECPPYVHDRELACVVCSL